MVQQVYGTPNGSLEAVDALFDLVEMPMPDRAVDASGVQSFA